MNWKQPIPTNLEEIFKDDYACMLLYEQLIYRSAHKDGFFTYNKKTTPIKKGQTIFGRNKWALYLEQNNKTIERWLQKLEKVYNLLTIEPSNDYTIVTILNYDEITNMSNQMSNSCPTHVQPMTTSKSIENNNIIKKLLNQNLNYSDLYGIAVKKNVLPADVIKKYYEIIDRVNAGEFKSKWGKDLKRILPVWIKRDLENGKLIPMSEFDQLTIKDYAPGKYRGDDLWARATKARSEGRI